MRTLDASEVRDWVEQVLLDPERDLPIVAVTTSPRTGEYLIDVQALARVLRDAAEIVLLEDGEATWALAEALPARLEVYGGAARIWWPGLDLGSIPEEHPLVFVRQPGGAGAAFVHIVDEVIGESWVLQAAKGAVELRCYGSEDEPTEEEPDAGAAARESFLAGLRAIESGVQRLHTPPDSGPVRSFESVTGSILSIDEEGIRVDTPRGLGWLRDSELPLELIAPCLRPGLQIALREVGKDGDGALILSLRDMLEPMRELMWRSVEPGDVVIGRAQRARGDRVYVELLPRVSGFVHISEVDWSFVRRIEDFVQVGDPLPVQLLRWDRRSDVPELSIKRVSAQVPRPWPSLVPGGEPFVWSDPGARHPGANEASELRTRLEAAEAELENAQADRIKLREAKAELERKLAEARKELRAAQEQLGSLRRADKRLLESEADFLRAVRVAYASMCEPQDWQRYPLRVMNLGRSFLASLRELEGVELEKVIEVCAQVACGLAREMPARNVHNLHESLAGSTPRRRARDNARAYRCSLQQNTPGARRLHWWEIPGPAGGSVEFAGAQHHDDYSIAE